MTEPPQKRRKTSPPPAPAQQTDDEEVQSTDFKLAVLASLHPDRSQDVLLDYLLAYDGVVGDVTNALSSTSTQANTGQKRAIGYQSSLSAFAIGNKAASDVATAPKSLTKKGRTLHLYSPDDVEAHTPCSIIHNFLSPEDADVLLQELLAEAGTFRRDEFQMFDRTVQSPHTSKFYVDTWEEQQDQKTEYMYNGGAVQDVGKTPPELLRVSHIVRKTVNAEIQRRMERHVDSKKLKFQSPDEWKPNVTFVNCYAGGNESVGWHSDHLTYLGPRAVIGSLSLGVAREFRVRKIVPQVDDSSADEQGQIAIHLPHNSLLVMHAEMQEEWKHSIAPAKSIDPHPVAGNRRLNVTYRCYRDYLHPHRTPRCKCGVPAVLRCVQKRAVTRGRYMWMCHAGFSVGQKSCAYYAWADFDEDGRPPWAEGYKGNANLPAVETAP
ncbi:hypothetical protein BDY17DRAFT_288412 [Neohortaea acidophila]|uniref:Uncharacterized protein n=1 Tax=Neohortaea acidophila TaxID=245834 RepID=A0A6A6Q403_9PEZI|nr:uncharacterized protein BDY17DRAFT_288412 [Neohortaea acidophila]KAF2487140.1 hypothetical protein BDY17DRAFT_288412 [Neohortaea acidophila]